MWTVDFTWSPLHPLLHHEVIFRQCITGLFSYAMAMNLYHCVSSIGCTCAISGFIYMLRLFVLSEERRRLAHQDPVHDHNPDACSSLTDENQLSSFNRLNEKRNEMYGVGEPQKFDDSGDNSTVLCCPSEVPLVTFGSCILRLLCVMHRMMFVSCLHWASEMRGFSWEF